ncbi:alpha/beta hydrolase [Ahrensia sp. R2A130]|uniref:alpha/beta hydrolase n=1 Tax=Ahrensia sp. R2A130 TaxID=744979 RepID=UPI0002E8731F|nr:alpha/beta fold hydrolase [Ahrensia sp. R2A130]
MIFPAPLEVGPAVSVSGFELFPITTADGERLNAYHHPAEDGEPTIIVFHGNGSTASRMIGHGKALADEEYGVLLAEYRGYAGSTGMPSQTALVEDAVLIYDLLRQANDEPIAVWGHSLGAAVAVQLADQRSVAALVLESPFDSVLSMAQQQFWWLPVSYLLQHPFQSDAVIGNVEAPILIMHGDHDSVVPLEAGKRLHLAAPLTARFQLIEGAGHNNVTRMGGMAIGLEFLEGAL